MYSAKLRTVGLAYVQLLCVTDVGLVCVVERYDLTELKGILLLYYIHRQFSRKLARLALTPRPALWLLL